MPTHFGFPRSLVYAISSLLLITISAAPGAGDATHSSLPRGSPEAQGVSSRALLDFISGADTKLDAMHAFMLVRHGHVIAEGWWAPRSADTRHSLFSLSKSFTSTAVGLAVNERKLSIDDPVLKFFPDEAPDDPSENLKQMRVRDLLTMSTGQHADEIATLSIWDDTTLVRDFLALPVHHKPGTHFVYNTPATYMQSAIVQK